MKFTFKPSPNYRTKKSTTMIMRDLSMCLAAITVFAVIYYSAFFGASYGLRVVLLMVDSVVASLIAEAIWLKVTKKDIKTGIMSSYSWITAMILVLISSIDVSYFAIAVASIIALIFGKLVFGGFGQNIFNPAAFGEAIIMQSFSATKSADFATGATPTNVLNSYGWMLSSENFSSAVSQFGGLGKMFLGLYPSTIGSTCALLILICGIFLIVRKDIEWQTPVFYIGSVFIMTALIGAMHGAGFWYPAFQILAGGIMFGGIFMLTDPVTSPVTLPGRIVFAVGAAALTVIIRTKSNLADGVLYSILLMNMMTPAIDSMFDGNQIRDARKFRNLTLIVSAVLLAVTLGFGTQVNGKTPAAESAASGDSGSASSASAASLSADYSQNEAECTEDSNDGTTAVYSCSAKGYGLLNNVEGEGKNKVTVTVDLGSNTVTSVELKRFGDTEGVGSLATTDSALAAYTGKSISDDVDITTGATFTSDSINAMVQAALNGGTALASEETTGSASIVSESKPAGLALSGDFADYEAECEESSNDGSKAVYACSAKGYGLINGIEGEGKNKLNITVDLGSMSIDSIELKRFGDTEGVGSNATTDHALAAYAGKTIDDTVDSVSGATFTSESVAAMAAAALNAAAGN